MSTYNIIRQLPCLKTISEIDSEFGDKEMYTDEGVQRNFVWSLTEKRDYIQSVFYNKAGSSIVVADLLSCAQASKKMGDEPAYHRLWALFEENGFKWISLDGQNRIKTVHQFLNDEFSVSGTFYGLDGEAYEYKNTFFSKMAESVRNLFTTRSVVVTIICNACDEELADIFIDLNKGLPLNAQEKRQAKRTPIATWIRSYVRGTSRVWTKIATLSEYKLKRMADAELTAQSVMALSETFKKKNVGAKSIDSFYDLGIGHASRSSVKEYHDDVLDRATAIMDIAERAIGANKLKNGCPFRTWWALLFVAEYLYENGIDVAEGCWTDFFTAVYEIDQQLINDSKSTQATQIRNLQSEGLDDEEISIRTKDDLYYWRWVNRNQDGVHRNNRCKALVEKFIATHKTSSFLEHRKIDDELTDDETVSNAAK